MSDRYRVISSLLDDPQNLACVIRELLRREVTRVHVEGELAWELVVRPSLIKKSSEIQEKPWDEDDEKEYPAMTLTNTHTFSEPSTLKSSSMTVSQLLDDVKKLQGQSRVVGTVKQFIDKCEL